MSDDLVQKLRAYAREKVDEHREAMTSNLGKKGKRLIVDVALPGAAYFSVAAGGLAEVLHLLGDDCIQVDRFSGASGGACSCFLILANQLDSSSSSGPGRCPNSELLLRSYMAYGESEGTNAISRNWNAFKQVVGGVSSFWEDKYREVLQNNASWRALQQRSFVAVSAKPLEHKMGSRRKRYDDETFEAVSDNYLLHNFSNVEQAVQAFVATGEATMVGFTKGINVVDADEKRRGTEAPERTYSISGATNEASSARLRLPTKFCDGGHPTVFQSPSSTVGTQQPNGLLYFHTWYRETSDAAFCTPDSIERLFKSGVDRTIECLSDPNFVTHDSGKHRMSSDPDKLIIIWPDSELNTQLAALDNSRRRSPKEFDFQLTDGAFVDLQNGVISEV